MENATWFSSFYTIFNYTSCHLFDLQLVLTGLEATELLPSAVFIIHPVYDATVIGKHLHINFFFSVLGTYYTMG